MTTRVCPVCQKRFKPNHPNQRFCSTTCYETWNKLGERTRKVLQHLASSRSTQLDVLIKRYGIRATATAINVLKRFNHKPTFNFTP